MNTDASIDFLAVLERQLETADERGLDRRRPRLRRATTAVTALVVLAVVAGGTAMWSHWAARDTDAGSGGSGQGVLHHPSPSPPQHQIRGVPAMLPVVPVVTSLVADPSGRVWLAGRSSHVGDDGDNRWVAYLESGSWHRLPVPFEAWGPFVPISPTDMWFAASEGFTHWDGTAVTTTTVPFLDGDTGWITDMAATGADDVWAVGHRAGTLYKTPGDGPGEHTQGALPVGMRWDGSAWLDLRVPDYPGRTSELTAVSAKDSEIWAVGHFEQKLGERDSGINLPDEVLHRGAIAIRWDGERWVKVDVGALGDGNVSLEDVQVLGPDDVWVLGSEGMTSNSTETLRGSQQVVAHWDGNAWTRIPGPDGVRRDDDHPMYRTLSATSDADLWLGGDGRLGVGDAELVHWDGTSWDVVPMADLDARGAGGTVGAAEATVLALGSSDVWFNTGFTSYEDDDPQAATPSIAHWDGSSWTQVTMPK